jgi:hypothetical protein
VNVARLLAETTSVYVPADASTAARTGLAPDDCATGEPDGSSTRSVIDPAFEYVRDALSAPVPAATEYEREVVFPVKVPLKVVVVVVVVEEDGLGDGEGDVVGSGDVVGADATAAMAAAASTRP